MNDEMTNLIVDSERKKLDWILIAQSPILLLIIYYVMGVPWNVNSVVIGVMALIVNLIFVIWRTLLRNVILIDEYMTTNGQFENMKADYIKWHSYHKLIKKMSYLFIVILIICFISTKIFISNNTVNIILLIMCVEFGFISIISFNQVKRYLLNLVNLFVIRALESQQDKSTLLRTIKAPHSLLRTISESLVISILLMIIINNLFYVDLFRMIIYTLSMSVLYSDIIFLIQTKKYMLSTLSFIDSIVDNA